MRIPIRHLAGNVIFTTQGSVWALWRVEGSGQAHMSRTAKLSRLAALEGLVKQLRGEAMLLSLCPQVDPVTVAEQMTAGIDVDASPRYAAMVERVLDQLDALQSTSLPLSGRTDWLAVPLPVSRKEAIRDAAAAARAEVALALGLLPGPVSAREELRRLEQAERIAAAWPSGVGLRPAFEAEILWIYGHAARRGVADPFLPDAPQRRRGRGRGAAAFGQVVLAEGGLPAAGESDDGQEERAGGWGPFDRRWLQSVTEHGASYQALLALAEMPESFRFPGSEYLASLDAFDFPVDWVARLQVVDGSVAEAKSRRQARELANQYSEYEGEPAGPPAALEQATTALDDYRAQLSTSATEVEVRAMVALCTWGATPVEAEERAQVLAGEFAKGEYQLIRPRGEQEALWYGMLPGARTPRVMASFAQYLTARDFAMAGPFADTRLGDATGPLYGLQATTGGVRPVLVDWAKGPRDKAASAVAAFIGELGAGKTVAMKSATWDVLAGGRLLGVPGSRGRAVIVDRTPRQEWADFTRACPGTTQVITIDKTAKLSLDPLRTFTGADGRPDREEAKLRTRSFLTLLLGISSRSEEADALAEAIDTVLAGPGPSLPKLLAELKRRADADPCARRVARRLTSIKGTTLAAGLFDESLPVLDIPRADTVVFGVAELALPTREELAAGLDNLEDEKLFGRAAMYLIAAICRRICFHNRNEFCVAVWDECWWLTASPEGLALVLEFIRDGRKHGAGAFLGSHDGDDIGPEQMAGGRTVRGLVARKFLFRHTDRELARRGLAFLDLDPDDEDLLARVTSGLSPLNLPDDQAAARAGECLHRDLEGRIGAMKVLIPLDEHIEPHMYSDPIAKRRRAKAG